MISRAIIDVLGPFPSKALGERAMARDEFNTRWDRCRRRPTREERGEFVYRMSPTPHAKVVGLSAKQLRVNRVHELADAIKPWGGTLR